MTEHEAFVTWVHSVLRDAEIALHNGDAGPRRAIWSRKDPVTVLGAWKNASGQQQLDDQAAQGPAIGCEQVALGAVEGGDVDAEPVQQRTQPAPGDRIGIDDSNYGGSVLRGGQI